MQSKGEGCRRQDDGFNSYLFTDFTQPYIMRLTSLQSERPFGFSPVTSPEDWLSSSNMVCSNSKFLPSRFLCFTVLHVHVLLYF